MHRELRYKECVIQFVHPIVNCPPPLPPPPNYANHYCLSHYVPTARYVKYYPIFLYCDKHCFCNWHCHLFLCFPVPRYLDRLLTFTLQTQNKTTFGPRNNECSGNLILNTEISVLKFDKVTTIVTRYITFTMAKLCANFPGDKSLCMFDIFFYILYYVNTL